MGGIAAGSPTAAGVGVPGSPISESPDFATLVLHDAWDMNQYSDISQYMNQSGQRYNVANPAVANGQFTGQSVGNVSNGTNANFWPLFPGYYTAMLIGQVGHQEPIDASTYHCLYIAMKVDSGKPNQFGPDQFQVFWFADEQLNNGAAWGSTPGIQLYPGNVTPPHYYQVYKIDLNTAAQSGAHWNSRSSWQGLRIDPTINTGITFAVDWVRLTTCAGNNQSITWTPDSSITSAWVQAAGTTRYVRVATRLPGNDGRATIDVQGIPPGSYTVKMGTDTTPGTQTSQSPLVIGAAPIVDFVTPSFYSGPEFASQAGTPWDFNSASDVVASAHMSYSIHDGVLETTIPSGPFPIGADPQLFLNKPQSIAPATYRYLSFRMYTDWKSPWQNVPDGMIFRVIWGIQGAGGPTNRCWLVSQDIPFDIGWQTYWIDMGNAFNGKPEQHAGDCPAVLPSWTNSPPILDLRIDPDEDATNGSPSISGGGSFHHEIDWVRLNAPNNVAAGQTFSFQLAVNRDLSAISYFYTTDPVNSPTQHPARQFRSGVPSSGPNRIFLPLVMTPIINSDMGGLPSANMSYEWNTAGVSAGTYYICVVATGGGNTSTSCSQVPVTVS